VYFEWIDAVGHLFVLHSPPRLPDIPDDEYRKFQDAVEQSYVVQDEVIGEFMDRMGDDTVLMVISDHGFKTGASRLKNRPEIWAGNAAKWHRPNGIIALYGKGIKRGYTLRDASILDVAPTVLALQGLPRASDMPGRILDDAFEASLKQELNRKTVATLQREREEEVPASPAERAENDRAMKKLEALGYLTPDNADAHNNLGQRYQERGEFLKAVEEYKKAIALRPDLYTAYNNIAVCYGELGRLDEAEQALLKTIELRPDDFYAMNNLAVTYIHAKRMDDARRMAEMAVRTEPGYVNGRITLGSIYAMTGELELAEQQFLAALELEPDASRAAEHLAKVRRQMQLNQSKPGNRGE
jgi:tetratricopeptide (TPR) repeat protein